MAILMNPILGDVKGKIGGLIFQNSPSGNIIRSTHLPMKNNSQSQNTSRSNLRAINNIWNALSQTDKSNWNTFALDGYAPLRKQNVGQYNGRSAFVALNTIIIDNNRKLFIPDSVQIYPILPSPTMSFLPFLLQNEAPTYSISNYVYSSPGEYYPIKMSGCSLICNRSEVPPYTIISIPLAFDVIWEGIPSAGLGEDNLLDSNGHPLSFRIYMSTPVKFNGAKPSNLLKNCIWSSGEWLDSGAWWFQSTNFIVIVDVKDYFLSIKRTPVDRQWVVLTLVALGANGSCALCDSKYTQFLNVYS